MAEPSFPSNQPIENEDKKQQLDNECPNQEGETVLVAKSRGIPQPIDVPETSKPNSPTEKQGGNKASNRPLSTRSEVIIAGCTLALLFVAGVQGYTTFVQSGIMRGQLRQADKQIELAQGQLRQADRQIELAQGQLEQAKIASKQTDETIAQMKLEKRAWVSVDRLEAGEIKEGQPLTCELFMRNSGQSPAFMDGHREMSLVLKADAPPSGEQYRELFDLNPDEFPRNLEVSLPPGATFGTSLPSTVLPQSFIDEVQDGSREWYVIGAIFYRDVSGTRRGTSFCMVYDPNTKGFKYYGVNNRME